VGKMVRTKGSLGIGFRKDKGKQRKFYRGKPVKKKRKVGGVLKPYKPRRQRGDPIKLYFWEKRPMSKAGYRNWSRKLRPYAKRMVYHPLIRIDVDPSRISTVEEVKNLTLEVIGYEGTFIMRGFSNAKTKTHVKQVRLAVIKIVNFSGGLKAFVSEYSRLSRYWFFQGGK